ncbi:YdcF family protein [Corynebacterium godavarianum]|uniref:YdcF family protein n=1 Tax=Corynebacterium godavarianum TaxID=2054421 RepID=UPI001FCC5228|nr:YdcF family protein [Corynebacterium godavarianum]
MNSSPIVVLGARIVDGRPSRMLTRRLVAALVRWRTDARAGVERTIVVTGRGESGVMARWLAERGVPRELIVEEPHATSTNENLENSRALFPRASRLIVVTSNFHVRRTRVWAWHLGIPVEMVPARTPRRSRAKNYAREVVALPHSAARVAWRRLAHTLGIPPR